jgi:uncharacterized protein (TIGR02145 family)
MAENLRVTHFRNGDLIPQIKENDQWKHYPVSAYSNYNNGDTVRNNYGFLYNWFAVTDSRNVAPEGWHVPTIDEIKELAEYLGTEAEAGGKLKESGFEHWLPPNTGATNEVGFSALPGGYRSGNDGKFHTRGSNAYWWAKTESYHLLAWTKLLHWNFADVNRSYDYKTYGFSVRCIKDNQ